jgi:hypothetical protein
MNFFQQYFKYVGASESPNIYHRWTAVSIVGAMLGRNVYLPFGHSVIYPNMYIMLMGSPGARKGTAMGTGSKLLRGAGYTRFCPDRLSKERFLMEIKPYHSDEMLVEADLETLVVDAPSEVYAVAEEFTDLVGQGGMEFMTMLTKLWDNMSVYEHPKIHGKSIVVEKPTVNIFGANTAQGLMLAIPVEALGNGFMSRMIFVHSEPTNRKIAFPARVSEELRQELITRLRDIRETLMGEMTFDDDAMQVLDRIYNEYFDIDDPRFKHYGARRFTHLLKLCIIMSAAELQMNVTKEIAINANTLLHFTERRMPKALGEFGKSKNSDVANSIMEILHSLTRPMSINELFKKVHKDVSKLSDLSDVMKNLTYSDKVQVVTIQGKQGYMPLHVEGRQWSPDLLNEDFLTSEELM